MIGSIASALSGLFGLLGTGAEIAKSWLDRKAVQKKQDDDRAVGAMQQREEIRADEQERTDAARKKAAEPKTIDAAIDQLVASERVRDD